MTTRDPNNPTDLSPAGAKDYKQRIDAARGHTPVGGIPMPDMPRLDQPPPRKSPPPQAIPPHMSPAEYEKAVAEGRAVQGVGGAYPANQPQAITGEDGKPVNPPRPEGGLREQTIEQLAAINQANQHDDDEATEEDEDEEYFAKLGEVTRDILNNTERRKAIEEKITDELNFDDLITHQELRQSVPIRKGFKPTFRTPSADEDIFVKRLIGDENGSPVYMTNRYAVMNLTLGLYELNGQPLPHHLTEGRVPDKKLFWDKYQYVVRYPLIIVADLSANFEWFQRRVQKLLAIDKVKDF